MKIKTINCALTLCLTVLFTISPQNSHANKNHPFYHDVKQAYNDSILMYNSKVEQVLYSKMSEPKDIFERSGHGSELPKPRNAEEERIMTQTIESLYRQFFKKVREGKPYCAVTKIKDHFGQTPKERIGISSGGYYKLFISYWTLNIKLEENRRNNVSRYGYGNVYLIDSLLRDFEMTLAGLFFPSPGLGPIPIQTPECLRRQGVQDLLDMYAPTMTINELYEGVDPQKARWPILKSAECSKFTRDKKIGLIRQFIKIRVQGDELLKKKYEGKKVYDFPEIVIMDLPEATIVTIVESYWMIKDMTTKTDKEILESIESHRKILFPKSGPMPAPLTLSNYIKYRLNIEHSQGVPIGDKFVEDAIEMANEAYR